MCYKSMKIIWWRAISLSRTSTHLIRVVMLSSLLLSLSLAAAGSPEILADVTPAVPAIQDPTEGGAGVFMFGDCSIVIREMGSDVYYVWSVNGTHYTVYDWDYLMANLSYYCEN